MRHFGVLSFPWKGHLYPLTALGRELVRRGHEVTVFQVPDVATFVQAAGLGFCEIGRSAFAAGTVRTLDMQQSRLQGFAALRFIYQRFSQNAAMLLRDAPQAIRAAGIDALLVDQAELAGGTVTERLHLPFVTVIVTLPFIRDASVPFFCYHDATSRGVVARARNAWGNSRVERLGARNRAQINEARRSWRLPPLLRDEDFYSPLAQIAQVPKEFDFPERHLPPTFYYAGPFLDPGGRHLLDFPWERIDPTRPLVFVSMGTLQNGVERVFRLVAEACADLPVQMVISLGGGLSRVRLGALSGSPLVVDYAPQLELLRKAALTIFHGGLNTALESLACGVPMVALPVTIDQPGVGARIKRTHTGITIPVQRLSIRALRAAIAKVLTDTSYRNNARRFQNQIARANGVELAADLIEAALGQRATPQSNAGSPFNRSTIRLYSPSRCAVNSPADAPVYPGPEHRTRV